ncbi:galactose oxidase-like domain-containing protein [Nitrosomonas supralitoralis]|nr:galactose oxidase-like domain-containing protein [Nitrosomonas supralitoralis]
MMNSRVKRDMMMTVRGLSVAQRGRYFIFFCLFSVVLLALSFRGASIAMAAGPEAHIKGEFGPLHNWPIIPIAMMLMPDGRVFAYGTNPSGVQGAKMYFAIWDPSMGTGIDAFDVLPNTTETDIFCAGQAHIPGTGEALIIGGDGRVNNIRNYAVNDVNIFDPSTDTLVRQTQSMAFKRWYATAVTLPNGEHIVLGGRNDRLFKGSKTAPATEATYSSTPEVRATDGNWRTLTSATSDYAYGALGASSWFYPRAWVNPQGDLFILAHNGNMYNLNTSGDGVLSKYTNKIQASKASLSSVMFAPGKILTIRKDRKAIVVDLNNPVKPIVSGAGFLAKDRLYGTATVLANGHVWVNGGSSTGNDLAGAALDTELWNPVTNTWKATASAATARLYHSASLLLPDGTVITGGGGAAGPLTQLNGEIYYPPYLFKTDGSGELAPRPDINDAPATPISWDQQFSIEASESIARVTLVRVGAATHAFNQETRFFDLPFLAEGNIVTVQSPASPNLAPPGHYLLFVWNASGVPSTARFIQIG